MVSVQSQSGWFYNVVLYGRTFGMRSPITKDIWETEYIRTLVAGDGDGSVIDLRGTKVFASRTTRASVNRRF